MEGACNIVEHPYAVIRELPSDDYGLLLRVCTTHKKYMFNDQHACNYPLTPEYAGYTYWGRGDDCLVISAQPNQYYYQTLLDELAQRVAQLNQLRAAYHQGSETRHYLPKIRAHCSKCEGVLAQQMQILRDQITSQFGV